MSKATMGTCIAAALLLAGCMQSVGPGGVNQRFGPFEQSVGPGGVHQGAGPYGPTQSVGPGGVQQSAGPYGPSQSVGPGGVRQSSGGQATPASSCQVQCGSQRYSTNCPAAYAPVCQCQRAPYASCAER